MQTPQGIEQLLALAGTSPEWRAKVLADPLAAARESGIELTEGELNILRSVSHRTLKGMIEAFAKKHGFPWVKAAVGVSAAALLAGAVVPSLLASSRGIRPDEPPRATQTDDLWLTSLDEALVQARASNRAVMAAFPSPTGAKRGMPGGGAIPQNLDSTGIRQAALGAGLLPVKIDDPWLTVRNRNITDDEQLRYEAVESPYEALLEKYGIKGKLPVVLFLAPDGTELSRLVQPRDEAQLVEAVKAVPPLMAKWISDRSQETRPAPKQWSWGHRP